MLNRELINTGDEILSPDSKALYVYPASKEDLMKIILDAVGLKEKFTGRIYRRWRVYP